MIVDLTACGDVTEQHLADVSGTLDLSGQNITALNSGDLDGLSGITKVDISGNDIEYLPSHIFGDLISVEEINVSDDALERLPPEEFKHTASHSATNAGLTEFLASLLPRPEVP